MSDEKKEVTEKKFLKKPKKAEIVQELTIDEKVLRFENYQPYREFAENLKQLKNEKDKIGNAYLTSETFGRSEYLKQRNVYDNKIRILQKQVDELEEKLRNEMKYDDTTFKSCMLKFIVVLNNKTQYVKDIGNTFVLTEKEQSALLSFLISKAKNKEKFIIFIDITGKKCQAMGFTINNVSTFAVFSNVIKNVGFQKMERMARQFTKVVLSGEATFELFESVFSKMIEMPFIDS